MEREVRYCTTADGVRIAYKRWGNGDPLVFVVPMPGSVELENGLPMVRDFYEPLAAHHEIVRFDARGTGASQRAVDDVSVGAWARDVSSLVDHLGLTLFDVFAGPGLATHAAVIYAVERPGRVRRLILWEPQAVFLPRRDASSDAYRTLVKNEWRAMTRTLGEPFVTDRPPEERRLMARLYRETMTPDMLLRGWDLTSDVSGLLPQIRVPTLILHARADQQFVLDEARVVASLTPHASLVTIEARHAYFFAYHDQIVPRIEDFLAVSREGPAPPRPDAPPSRDRTATASRTIVYTDIEGNTGMLQRLGDDAWRTVLRDHERITRELLRAHGGTEVKTMGDGFMASFDSATSAVECAIDLQRSFAARNRTAAESLLVRVGLNAGEPIEEDNDLFGTAVTMAARIMAQGTGGEILVSDLVRGLVAGKGFTFADRGEFAPKGFDDAVRLYEVRWRD